METKRTPPPVLQKVLNLDVTLTKKFTLWANNYLPFRSLRVHYKMLEISCHGVPWFAFWIAFTWLFNNPSLIQMQVNMLLGNKNGLFLDVIFVAVIKSFVRRRRPMLNSDDKSGQIGPDKFSFPSGHASRAVFVAYFFINLYSLSIIFYPPLLAWATSVCLSRVLLNRHYLLDVFSGVFLGLFQGLLLGLIWFSEDTSKWLIGAISEETWSGGEYHV